MIPDVRPNQPSAHVRVPQFWWDMADVINADERPGKVLVMPLDDYYQMPTTWGFAGVDNIPNLLIQRPVVQPKPPVAGAFKVRQEWITVTCPPSAICKIVGYRDTRFMFVCSPLQFPFWCRCAFPRSRRNSAVSMIAVTCPCRCSSRDPVA